MQKRDWLVDSCNTRNKDRVRFEWHVEPVPSLSRGAAGAYRHHADDPNQTKPLLANHFFARGIVFVLEVNHTGKHASPPHSSRGYPPSPVLGLIWFWPMPYLVELYPRHCPPTYSFTSRPIRLIKRYDDALRVN